MDGRVALVFFIVCVVQPIKSTQINYCMVNGYHQAYDIEKQICCGNTLKTTFVNARCCYETGEVFDASRQVCCGGVHPIPLGKTPEDVGCCTGGYTQPTLYNTSDQQCCSGRLHSKQYLGQLTADGFCCGTKFIQTPTYDINKIQECCTNDLSPERSEAYYLKSQVCCAGTVHPILNNKSDCCGEIPYDGSRSLCCLDERRRTTTLHTGQGYGPKACCANAPGGLIDRETHMCIDDYPRSIVCDQTKFNPVTHHCCGTEVIPREMECCNGAVVEEGEVCCGPYHGPKPKTDARQDSCCPTYHSYQPYDSATAACRDGRVKVTSKCNGVTFDPERKTCCGGFLHRRMANYECCGRHLYTPRYFTCCDGIRRRGANRPCQ